MTDMSWKFDKKIKILKFEGEAGGVKGVSPLNGELMVMVFPL